MRSHENVLSKMILSLCKKVLWVMLLCDIVSCSPRNSLNKAFQKKYGKEVEAINSSRIPPEKFRGDSDVKLNFAPPRPVSAKLNKTSSQYEQYYANVDADEYVSTKPRRFFPDGVSYQQGKNAPKVLPDDMFTIPYYTKLYPPFRKSGVEFDSIKIPPHDSYGVITALSEKEYVLVGNNSLQKNIDQMNADRTEEDIMHSQILIKEQKQLRRRRKMIRVFGKDYVELEKSRNDDIVMLDEEEKVVDKKEGNNMKDSASASQEAKKDLDESEKVVNEAEALVQK